MLLPRLSSLLGLVGLATVPVANAYDDNANIKSIPVRLRFHPVVYWKGNRMCANVRHS